MRKFFLLALFLVCIISSSISQVTTNNIKIITTVVEGEKTFYCPSDRIVINIRIENAAFDDIIGEKYTIHNFDLFMIKPWIKKDKGVFEMEIGLEIKEPVDDIYSYIFINSINDFSTNNINQLAFTLNKAYRKSSETIYVKKSK